MSKPMPYVPMGKQLPLAGEAEIAAMHAKLAAKVTHRGEVMNPPASAAQGAEARNLNTPQCHGLGAGPQGSEAQATQHSAAPIEWEKPSDPLARLIHSKCGKWRVRKWHAEHYGWRYQAESLTENLWWYQCGPSFGSFADVRRHIEESRK